MYKYIQKYASYIGATAIAITAVVSAALTPLPSTLPASVATGESITAAHMNDVLISLGILDERTTQDCTEGYYLQGFDTSGVKICVPQKTPNHIITKLLPYDQVTYIAPLNGVTHPSGTTYSLVAGSQSNATVTLNADGTHAVIPSPASCGDGEWSYEYETTFSDGSTTTAMVKGVVDNALIDIPFSTNQAAGSDINLAITTTNGGDWNVLWGDGDSSTDNPSGATYLSHNYSAAYDGDVIVQVQKCDGIKEIRSNSGAWDFTLSDLPEESTYIYIYGQNTISGNIANLPSENIYFFAQGQNTISGDIANLPSGNTLISLYGNNTLSGDIANLPSGNTYLDIQGQNTLSGDIANLPSGNTYLSVAGQNTISGDIANLPSGNTAFYVQGNNTISGDIANFPSGNVAIAISGQNTVYGDIANLPSGNIAFTAYGQNTVYGDIANLPSGNTYLSLGGNNTVTASSTTWSASSSYRYFNLVGSTTRTATEIDNILVALSNVSSWSSNKQVVLNSPSNAAPSTTGLAAKATIEGNGAEVFVN